MSARRRSSSAIRTATIPANAPPNYTITVGNVTVIANEQTRTPSVNPKTIDVNALHIVVGDPLENVVLADVVIAHSHADVVCQGGPPNCDRARFVAGGGWINSGTSTANFAIAGRNGDPSTWRHAVHVTR